MKSLHQSLLRALQIVQTLGKEDDTEVNDIGKLINPKWIGATVLDLEYDTDRIHRLPFKKVYYSP